MRVYDGTLCALWLAARSGIECGGRYRPVTLVVILDTRIGLCGVRMRQLTRSGLSNDESWKTHGEPLRYCIKSMSARSTPRR